jgi:hypothetical protein
MAATWMSGSLDPAEWSSRVGRGLYAFNRQNEEIVIPFPSADAAEIGTSINAGRAHPAYS